MLFFFVDHFSIFVHAMTEMLLGVFSADGHPVV